MRRTVSALGLAAVLAVMHPAATPAASTWAFQASMNSPRWKAAAAEVSGAIYVFGGDIYAFNDVYMDLYLDTVESLTGSAKSRSWVFKSNLPVPMRSMTATAVGDKVYIIGGLSGGTTLDTVWQYDPGSDTYSSLAPMATPRFDYTAVEVGGKIYVMGGQPLPGGDALDFVEVYNPSSNAWSVTTAMPTRRWGHGAARVGSRIYVMGGHNLGSFFLDSMEEYHTATDTWQQVASLPVGRAHLAAATIAGRVYATGGDTPTSILSDVLEYNPSTDGWSAAPSMNSVRDGHAALAAGGRLYVIGGIVDNAGNTTQTVEAAAVSNLR